MLVKSSAHACEFGWPTGDQAREVYIDSFNVFVFIFAFPSFGMASRRGFLFKLIGMCV